MPLRSPKMYSFIFGFQRFVWWPKCTPASSRSFIAIAAKFPPFSKCELALAELEALARSSHAVLLPLLGARVARQHPFVFQTLAQLCVVLDQCARDAQPDRPGLSRHAAAGDCREDIELVRRLGQQERPANLRALGFGREERLERSMVDADCPRSRAEKHAGGRCLAPPGSVVLN